MKKRGPKDGGYTIKIPASVPRNCQVPRCKNVAVSMIRHRWRCKDHGGGPEGTFLKTGGKQ